MPLVTANGLSFHVQEVGAGPPVVMLHGLLIGSLASWYFTAAPTLARTHRVRVYDLRGHGRSERAKSGYDVRTMARDLEAMASDLPGEIDLVGHSWGALVALRFALDHPGRVRRLVLVEAPLPPSRAMEMADFTGFAAVASTSQDARERLLDALPATLREAVARGRRQAERLLDSLAFLVFESSLVADLRGERDVDDAELARLSPKTLCLYGNRSACLPAGERIARTAPDAQLHVLEGGHYLHLDARGPLVDAIERFLGG